jgi:molecular chaperone DnaK
VPSPVLGIDLGTTNSVVACADEQRVRVLRDEDGQLITPSTVSFDPSGRMLVGHEARERRLVDARNTIFSVKRLIGRPFRSPEVQLAAARLPFALEEGATGGVAVRVRGETYSLPEIASFILRKVRALAESALGQPCANAVITVPANFNELQRMATRDAGRIAGLNVLRILNEPTAAALAYGYRAKQGQRIAVYDLGGGTFDISILELSGDVIEVVATAGDTNLGGDDLDSVVADRMVAEFQAKFGADLAREPQQYERVRMAAEWIKCQLSHQESAEAIVKEVAWGPGRKPLDLHFKLSRPELHAMAAPLINRTFTSCEEALRLAGVRPVQLDSVILVGGQTRTPAVRQMVAEFFAREPQTSVDPELVVAQGAALQGYALSGVPAADIAGKVPRTLLGNPPPGRTLQPRAVRTIEDDPTQIAKPKEEAGGQPRKPAPAPPKRSEMAFEDLPTTMSARPDPDDEVTRVGEYVTAEETDAMFAAAQRADAERARARAEVAKAVGPKSSSPPSAAALAARLEARKSGSSATDPLKLRAPGISVPPAKAPPAKTRTKPPEVDIALVDSNELPAALRDPEPAGQDTGTPNAARQGEASDPIRTHSMARLLVTQGHRGRAATIYAELIVSGNHSREVLDEARALGVEVDVLVRATDVAIARAHAAERQAPLVAAAVGQAAGGARMPPPPRAASSGRPPAPPASEPDRDDRGWKPSDAPLKTLGAHPEAEAVLTDPSLFLSESQLLRSQFPGPPSRAPLLLDVTTHTLAVETAGGFCEPIIERNAPIPTEQTRVFSTSQDDQATVNVRVCQGESRRTDENQVLGQIALLGLRKARRGEVSIAVTFMIDADGTLNVKAIDRSTGEGQAIRVDLVGAIEDHDLERMRSRQPAHSQRPRG